MVKIWEESVLFAFTFTVFQCSDASQMKQYGITFAYTCNTYLHVSISFICNTSQITQPFK